MNIKKYLIIFLSLVLMFALSACGAKDADSSDITKTDVNELVERYEDPEFWDSLNLSVDLIKNSIEPDKNISVSFRLRDSDGTTIILEDVYKSHDFVLENDDWQDMVATEIKYDVATSTQVIDAHDFGQFLKVTGVILQWDDQQISFSVADINANGEWDVATEGIFFFTDKETIRMPGTENEFGAIGVVNVDPTVMLRVADDANLSDITVQIVEGR